MPLGVEHESLLLRRSERNWVSQPLMPLGVEHQQLKVTSKRVGVSQPLMPLGVEHNGRSPE